MPHQRNTWDAYNIPVFSLIPAISIMSVTPEILTILWETNKCDKYQLEHSTLCDISGMLHLQTYMTRVGVCHTLAIVVRSAALLLTFHFFDWAVLCWQDLRQYSGIYWNVFGQIWNRRLKIAMQLQSAQKKNHLCCMRLLQRRYKRETVAQQNLAIFGKQ